MKMIFQTQPQGEIFIMKICIGNTRWKYKVWEIQDGSGSRG
jgi:hypothetical protein